MFSCGFSEFSENSGLLEQVYLSVRKLECEYCEYLR